MPPDNGGRRPGATPADRHQHDRLRQRVTRQRSRALCHWPATDPLAVAAALTWAVTR